MINYDVFTILVLCFSLLLTICIILTGTNMKNNEIRDSLLLLLNKDVEIVCCSKHLYRNSKGVYTILLFDKHGNLKSSIPEETFETPEDAVDRFISLVGDKLE